MDETIAITGLGLVSALGSSVESFYQALESGAGAVAPDEELGKWVARSAEAGDPWQEGRPIQVARVGDFGAREAIDPQKLRRIPRLAQFCIVAARQALGQGAPAGSAAATDPIAASAASSGDPTAWLGDDRDRIGVVLGTGLGAFDQTMEFTAGYLKNGPEGASPAMFPITVMNTAAAMVAMELKLGGTNITVNHRDLSLLEAVAGARDQLLCGRADAILAGGFDELGPWVAHAQSRLCRLLPPGGVMRPYDRRRGGIALGEGAVVVLLERRSSARRRGARILAEIAGIGRAGDDRPRIGWRRPGQSAADSCDGAARAIELALCAAGLPGDALGYIAGGGNGTDLDLLETAALRRALGAAADRLPISSILGQCGESMMSAGLRLGAALYALERQAVPGTAFCEEPDPQAALGGLCLRGRAAQVHSVLLPCLAQGGGNLALVLRLPT